MADIVYVCPTYVGMTRKRPGIWAYPTVCPTYVGMNHLAPLVGVGIQGMPHVCGDEPFFKNFFRFFFVRMPHVCGDEPLGITSSQAPLTYAPRMWG